MEHESYVKGWQLFNYAKANVYFGGRFLMGPLKEAYFIVLMSGLIVFGYLTYFSVFHHFRD